MAVRVLIVNFNYTVLLFVCKIFTLWYLKKVFMDKQSGPMRENILNTLDADPPANKIAWQRRKLPAGNFDPARNGWLCQVPFGLDTWGLSKLLLQQLGCQPHVRQLVDYLLCSYDRNQIVGASG